MVFLPSLLVSKGLILQATAWIVNIFFFSGLVFQGLHSFRIKCGRGLSDLTLFGYFNGYIAYLYYAFCFNLPIAYRVMIPLCMTTMLVMLAQRFLYAEWCGRDKKMFLLYLLNGLAAILILPHAFKQPWFVGNVAGWIEISIWALYQIPQVFKIHLNKSVIGFSFLLVSMVGIGDTIELIVAISLGMPWQTIINDMRGILIYSIFCVQFWLYNQKA